MTDTKQLAKRDMPEIGSAALPKARYEKLRDRCAEIITHAECCFISSVWELGQAIVTDLGAERQEYGAQVVHQLAADLGMDHTNVYRAIQLYETYPKNIFAPGRQSLGRILTWKKAKMLLPLDPKLRAEMEKKLASGAIRTDEQLRLAILERKQELGLIDMDFTRPQTMGVKGLPLEKARTLLRKIGPDPDQAFGLLGIWAEDWAKQFIGSNGVPEERRVGFKRAARTLGQQLIRMSEER